MFFDAVKPALMFNALSAQFKFFVGQFVQFLTSGFENFLHKFYLSSTTVNPLIQIISVSAPGRSIETFGTLW